MVILISGVSGIGISNSIKKFLNNYQEFYSTIPHLKPIFIKVDKEIEELYFIENPEARSEDNKRLWVTEIMPKVYPVLKEYWEKALKNILDKINKIYETDKNKIVLVNLTSCYFHPDTQEYFSLVNIELLKKLEPKMIITFIDDIFEIQYKLKKKETGLDHQHGFIDFDVAFKLIRYLDWRSKEIMMSRFYSNQLPSCERNYIFAIKHSFKTFANLLFEKMDKIYLSHPISEVRNIEVAGNHQKTDDFHRELKSLSQQLTNNFITFLPTTIDEYRIKNEVIEDEKVKYSPVLLKRWDIELYKNPDNLLYIDDGFDDVNELWKKDNTENNEDIHNGLSYILETLYNLIGLHVTTRDLSLVEQCDHLVIYRPFFNGKLSYGVKKEKIYALSFKKLNKPNLECYVYCPKSDLNTFYLRQFKEKLLNELINGDNLYINDVKNFGELSPPEEYKILNGAVKNDKGILNNALSIIIDNHKIEVRVREKTYPLQKSKAESFFEDFSIQLLKVYNLVEEFKKDTIFFDYDKPDINDFFNKVYSNINIKKGNVDE